MKTAKELVAEINEKKLCSPHFVEDDVDINGAKEIGLIDGDEHRWYVIGTVVYKIGDEFFGVRGPVSLKSESMDYSDCDSECEAFEMVAIPSVSYKRKEDN